jgi:hypothetical protein
VKASDLINREDWPNYNNIVPMEYKNFLETYSIDLDIKTILTNPPYSEALSFVKKAIQLIPPDGMVCFLLRVQFLEGKERGKFFEEHPPHYMYLYSGRAMCYLNGEKTLDSSAVAYAWFIWDKDYKGDPIVKWIK